MPEKKLVFSRFKKGTLLGVPVTFNPLSNRVLYIPVKTEMGVL